MTTIFGVLMVVFFLAYLDKRDDLKKLREENGRLKRRIYEQALESMVEKNNAPE